MLHLHPQLMSTLKSRLPLLIVVAIILAVGMVMVVTSQKVEGIFNQPSFDNSSVEKSRANYYRFLESEDYKDNLPFIQGANPMNIFTTYDRLIKKFEYDPTGPIEKHIFQIWKSNKRTETGEVELPTPNWFSTWSDLNPGYNHILLTDDSMELEILSNFIETVPEVKIAYDLLPTTIIKTDLIRYIWIYLHGGTYADLDVEPKYPISKWVDARNDKIKAVLSLEGDFNTHDWQNMLPRRIQLTQWTFHFKKHHPALAMVIAKIVKVTIEGKLEDRLVPNFKDFNKDIENFKSIDIMEWTGPGIFTDGIFQYMNLISEQRGIEIVDYSGERGNTGQELFGPETGVQGSDQRINWKLFTGMDAPIIVDDVAILASRGYRCESHHPEKYCYARHYFKGTWKAGEN